MTVSRQAALIVETHINNAAAAINLDGDRWSTDAESIAAVASEIAAARSALRVALAVVSHPMRHPHDN